MIPLRRSARYPMIPAQSSGAASRVADAVGQRIYVVPACDDRSA